MSDMIATLMQSHFDKIETSIKKYEEEAKHASTASAEAKSEVKALADKFEAKLNELNAVVTDVAQKQVAPIAPSRKLSAGEEFVGSDEFKSLATGRSKSARVELKNTILADNTTTTFPQQLAGVVPGAFRPLTIRDVLPLHTANADSVRLIREATFTNNAREQTEGQNKIESAVTFNQYTVPIETIATWLKVSKQLLADAPAVASYIQTRLRFMVDDRVDGQLLNGNGTSPNISGLLDSGNYTVYTPTAGDNLIQAINRAKYALWTTGYLADAVIVNPADWGAQEIERESGTSGMYLYGMPGMNAGLNPFGIRVVISSSMTTGSFLVGAFGRATGLWQREGLVVEMGYVDDDFTRNLVTMLAEVRLGLEVSVPAALLGGSFTS